MGYTQTKDMESIYAISDVEKIVPEEKMGWRKTEINRYRIVRGNCRARWNGAIMCTTAVRKNTSEQEKNHVNSYYFTDCRGYKFRPALVVSSNQSQSDDLIITFISTILPAKYFIHQAHLVIKNQSLTCLKQDYIQP